MESNKEEEEERQAKQIFLRINILDAGYDV